MDFRLVMPYSNLKIAGGAGEAGGEEFLFF